MEGWESTQEAGETLGSASYPLKRFSRALPTTCVRPKLDRGTLTGSFYVELLLIFSLPGVFFTCGTGDNSVMNHWNPKITKCEGSAQIASLCQRFV